MSDDKRIARGTVYRIFDAEQVTERFTKREFVLKIQGPEIRGQQRNEHVLFQLTGRRVDLIDGFREGQEAEVEFVLKGREWTSKSGDVRFFNSLEVFAVSAADGQQPDVEEPPPPSEPPPNHDDDFDPPF
ncbi:MAG: DUF3127 domain-containing protein [Myxococcota bacterium]